MKDTTMKSGSRASAEVPIQQLLPQPDLPAERYTHTVVMNVFGRRFELIQHMEVREIKRGPAKVSQMPTRAL